VFRNFVPSSERLMEVKKEIFGLYRLLGTI